MCKKLIGDVKCENFKVAHGCQLIISLPVIANVHFQYSIRTFEVEVDVGVAVAEGVEGVAAVHAAVRQPRTPDGQRQHEPVLPDLAALRAQPLRLPDRLRPDQHRC